MGIEIQVWFHNIKNVCWLYGYNLMRIVLGYEEVNVVGEEKNEEMRIELGCGLISFRGGIDSSSGISRCGSAHSKDQHQNANNVGVNNNLKKLWKVQGNLQVLREKVLHLKNSDDQDLVLLQHHI